MKWQRPLVIFLMLAPRFLHAQCGDERWEVKTLTDSEAPQINFTPKKSTVHEQLKFNKPPFHDNNPRDVSEKQVYQIDCILLMYKNEEDNDWHLVVKDLVTNEKMVIEIPDPECAEVKSSPHLKNLKKVRQKLTARIGPIKNKMWKAPANTKMRVTGVGFFDKSNHPKGFKGRELHPVLSIVFL
jgi:protein-tyrosine-phosphatase